MTDIHNLPSDYERRLSDTIGTLCLVGAVVYTRHHRQGHDTEHNMSKEMSDEHKRCCDGQTQDTTCRRDVRRTQKMLRRTWDRTQHVERDVRRTQKMLRWTDTGHNMSKEMSDEHKECCDGQTQDTTCRKRCQTNTKDVAMDMRQNTTCRKRCQTNTKDVAIGTFGKLKTVLKAWFKGKSRGEQSKFSFFCSTNKRKRTLIQQNGWMCVVKNKENVSVIFLWILPMWSSPKLLGWSSPFVFLFSFIFWWRHRGKYKIFKRKEKKKEKKEKEKN